MLAALLLGVGGGTGWWFIVGQSQAATADSTGTHNEEAQTESVFVGDDLETLLLPATETLAIASLQGDATDTSIMLNCETSELCLGSGGARCEELNIARSTAYPEPAAARLRSISSGTTVQVRHFATQLANSETVESQLSELKSAAESCVANSGAELIELAEQGVTVYAGKAPGKTFAELDGSGDAGWLLVARGNTLSSVLVSSDFLTNDNNLTTIAELALTTAASAAPTASN